MAKLILFNDYIKAGKTNHFLTSLAYMATRDGVELNENSVKIMQPLNPTTASQNVSLKQKELINKITKQYPDLKEQPSHETFEQNKNMYTASLFITESLEMLEELAFTNENYIKYIAFRPGVEKKQGKEHGLFDQTGSANLNNYNEELKNHDGNVWRSIISLRREDAHDLDFENQDKWKDMIQKHIDQLAMDMKIQRENFHWCAAFHNESYHPHIVRPEVA